tara:strand:+ start:817 stop:1578 length:762 start_codon:yes stop_codon:yes gene_type:complete
MKIFIVMPGLNVAKTLEKTFNGLPNRLKENVIYGDNCSTDSSVEIAKNLGLTVIKHKKNLGFGGNLKVMYKYAIDNGADIVVDLHPDYQYEPSLIDLLVAYIERGHFNVMQGNRIRRRDEAKMSGMPNFRYLANRSLSLIENLWFGTNFGEWHTGLKAFSVNVLKELPYENYPNTHAFATDILMDCVQYGFSVGEVPIPIRYESESSSTSFSQNIRYAFRVILSLIKRPPWKKKKYKSNVSPPYLDNFIKNNN